MTNTVSSGTLNPSIPYHTSRGLELRRRGLVSGREKELIGLRLEYATVGLDPPTDRFSCCWKVCGAVSSELQHFCRETMKQSLKIPSHLKRVALHYLVELCCSEFGLII